MAVFGGVLGCVGLVGVLAGLVVGSVVVSDGFDRFGGSGRI